MAVAAHFLEIRGADGHPIEGESYGIQPYGEAPQHVGSIDVSAWNWQATNQAAKPGMGRSKLDKTPAAPEDDKQKGVEPGTLTFQKVVDRSTIRLMQAMNNGEKLKLATFVLLEQVVDVKNVRGGAFVLHVILENPVIVSYSLSGSASEFRVELDEVWELSYSKITFAYESAKVFVDFRREAGAANRRQDQWGSEILGVLKQYGIQPDRKKRVPRG